MPIRIPMAQRPQVNEKGLQPQYENFNREDGTTALQAGLAKLTSGVNELQSANEALALKAREKADQTAADSLFTQAQAYTTQQIHGYDEEGPETDVVTIGLKDNDAFDQVLERRKEGGGKHHPGYLDTRGTEAHRQSGETLERLSKKYDELLKAAGTERQRELVKARLQHLLEGTRAQIAVHEGQQFRVAQEAATSALLDTTLKSAASMYNQPEQLAPLVDDALASMKRTVLPEKFEAAKGEYLSKVSQQMVASFLANGDVEGAEGRFKADQKLYDGDTAEKVAFHIDRLKKAKEQEHVEYQAQVTVQNTIDEWRNEYGFLRDGAENTIRDEIEKQYPERRKEMSAIAERQINVEAERREAIIKSWVGEAKTLRLRGGTRAIGADLMQRLEEFAPDYVERIRDDDQTRWQRAEARKSSNRDRLRAEREQNRADQLALTRFKAMSWREQATFEEKHGFEGNGLSELGVARLQEQARKAKNYVENGGDAAREKLDNEADAAIGQYLVKKGKPLGNPWDFKASVADDLESFMAKNNRAPTAEERTKILSDNLLKAETKPQEPLLGIIPRGNAPEYDFERKKREKAEAEKKGQVEVRKGKQRGLVPADKVDAWLAKPENKGWSR